jgi:diaminopimelate decarboxylase
MTTAVSSPWWARPGLAIRDGRLFVGGVDAEALARAHGTPLFAYDLPRFAENAGRLPSALTRAGLAHRLRFALKANREPEVLAVLRSIGRPGDPSAVGIDACSPGEVVHALAHGWLPQEISFTGTNVSERDLDVLLAHSIHLNLDAVSWWIGWDAAPGRTVGLRVNRAGAGYHERSRTAAPGRRSSVSTRIASTKRSRSPGATTSRSTRSTSTPGRAGSPTAWADSSRPSSARQSWLVACSMKAARSAR